MKKKILAGLLCVAMTVAAVAGCGSSGDAVAYHFEIIVPSAQSSYGQAFARGVEQAAGELGVTCNCTGPDDASNAAARADMLQKAIDAEGTNGIGLAASGEAACFDALQAAKDKGIPVVCFDGVQEAPEGAVYATITTDNYQAGTIAAENLYGALKGVIAEAGSLVRIGEINEEDVSGAVADRGLGFIDRFAELAVADGRSVAVIGNERYVKEAKAETVAEEEANIIIEVGVPDRTTGGSCEDEAFAIMDKADTIGIFGSSQAAAEGILTANEEMDVLGMDAETSVLAVGFDSGSVIRNAIRDGKMYGAVTRSPFETGITVVRTLYAIAQGQEVSDISVKGCWYDSENMEDDGIASNLYD